MKVKKRWIAVVVLVLLGILCLVVLNSDIYERITSYHKVVSDYDKDALTHKAKVVSVKRQELNDDDLWLDVNYCRFGWPFGEITESILEGRRLMLHSEAVTMMLVMPIKLPQRGTPDSYGTDLEMHFPYGVEILNCGDRGWWEELLEQELCHPYDYEQTILEEEPKSLLTIIQMERDAFQQHLYRLLAKQSKVINEDIRFFKLKGGRQGFIAASKKVNRSDSTSDSSALNRIIYVHIEQPTKHLKYIFVLNCHQETIDYDAIYRMIGSMAFDEDLVFPLNAADEKRLLDSFTLLPNFVAGIDAVYLAIQENDEEKVRKLIDFISDINATTLLANDQTHDIWYSKATLIHCAVAKDNQNLVKMLLKHGADINAQSENGDTPLHTAVRMKNIPMARFLMRNGANPEIEDVMGISPTDLLDGDDYLTLMGEERADVPFAVGEADAVKIFQDLFRKEFGTGARGYSMFKSRKGEYYVFLFSDPVGIYKWIKVDGRTGEAELDKFDQVLYRPKIFLPSL